MLDLIKGRTRSDAQTESAFPPALFSEFILGVRPTEPGLREVTVYRSSSGLRRVEGVIPSPMGNLLVRWHLDETDGGTLQVEVPEGMRVKLDMASLGAENLDEVLVNGRLSGTTAVSEGYLTLDWGQHEVVF